MNKLIIGVVALLVFNGCVMTQTVVETPSSVNMPKKALFISQSGTESNLLQTLIDLENNEMVVLTYSDVNVINITRTGIYLNPDDYKNKQVKGTDAPFKEKVKPPKPIEPIKSEEK
ncbi:hypothetical protein [Ancylomarina longa]|uniref:Uncharacterized protein n=1 Tax=Ancylomarina longa TaxID=2487017 RepID=A0A434AGM9_9BACT|nr:hypothetical protein [Ancylomarina longa]RUT73542.1 hypothetical protein DLK05_12600 [Ancylomarina longa]